MFKSKEINEKIKSIDDTLNAILFYLKKISSKNSKNEGEQKNVYTKL